MDVSEILLSGCLHLSTYGRQAVSSARVLQLNGRTNVIINPLGALLMTLLCILPPRPRPLEPLLASLQPCETTSAWQRHREMSLCAAHTGGGSLQGRGRVGEKEESRSLS